MEPKEQALFIFRKLVYLLYLEIGALQPKNHPQVAAKARLNTAFFQREKDRQAAELYYTIENETDPFKILAPFEERTGLTLNDIHQAFAEGDWRNKHGGLNFGGPKWGRIAALSLELRDAIDQGQWDEVARLLQAIKSLKTNQGYLINLFERTERRR